MHFFNPSLIAVACFSFQAARAHMMVKSPAPRCSKYDTQVPPSTWDYSYTAPIGTNDKISQPLCKYPKPENPMVTWKAGQKVTIEFEGTANHGGGWCQLAVSYDLNNSPGSFVRVGDPIPNCPMTGQPISVTLPSDLSASEHAVGTWIWNNKVGNREMYMNCFDVKIQGPSHSSFTGPAAQFYNYGPSSPTFGEGDAEMAKLGDALKRAQTITVPCSGIAGASQPNNTILPYSPDSSISPDTMYSSTVIAAVSPTSTNRYETDSSKGYGSYVDLPSPSDEPDYSRIKSEDIAVTYPSETSSVPYPKKCSSAKPIVCKAGSMKCVDDITFFTCDHGNGWIPRTCFDKSKCKQNGDVIACV
jgi:hypothetical protein